MLTAGLVAAAPRQADRAPRVEEGPALALVAPGLAPQPGQPGGRLVAPQQHALPPLRHGLLQRRQRGVGDHHRRPALARQHAFEPRAERTAQPYECRHLAGRRAADQRLPQDHGLAPGLGDAGRHALAAQAGDGRQQGLRDVILRRARPLRGILHPFAPLAPGRLFRGKAGSFGAALLQQAGVDCGPRRRRGRGRLRSGALRPVVAEDGRWVGDVDFSERHRPLLSVGTARIRHNIAQLSQVTLTRLLKFARLLRMLGGSPAKGRPYFRISRSTVRDPCQGLGRCRPSAGPR